MNIGSIGYNYSHGSDFEMDRPNGVGCGLMLFVKTPALFEIDGTEYTVRDNSLVIFTASTPCRYRPLGDVYTDDWLYFGYDDNDLAHYQNLGIPVNKPVYLGNIDELSMIMQILSFEHYSADAYIPEVESHYLNIMLYKVSRIIQSGSVGMNEEITRRNMIFTKLRSRIYTMPEKIGSIEDMAKETGMSRSGFQHLYKRIFGVNVMTDVINGRLDRAKRLLTTTTMTIREIAEKCGYQNEYNFMRQFKNYEGRTPSEYRNNS